MHLASMRRRRLLKKMGVDFLALARAGEPGVGKIMSFLKKGALEWAKGNIWTNIELHSAVRLTSATAICLFG